MADRWLIVPTLRVGMHSVTLCVTAAQRDAERPKRHSHAERGNDQQQKGPLSKRAFCLGAIQIRT